MKIYVMDIKMIKHCIRVLPALLLAAVLLVGCGATKDPDLPPAEGLHSSRKALPFEPAADGSNYLEPVYRNLPVEEMEEAAAALTPAQNVWPMLSVPTWVTRVGETWFIVDCYHNQIIYNDRPDALYTPLNDWLVMTADATQCHTLASDGEIYLADDTENNRVLVFERTDRKFINTQIFWNVGDRPHYTVYDRDTDTWYVLSSRTGELHLFRRAQGTNDIYKTEIRSIDRLKGIYIRSFTIAGDRIYFVSGVPAEENADYTPAIYCCSLDTLEILAEYPVPDEFAGMTQLVPVDGKYWLISVSTDIAGNQDTATLLRADHLSDLEKGVFTDIYGTYFAGGGTPYYISRVDDRWFLTEHRLEDHTIWSFKPGRSGEITEIEALY